MPGHGDCDHGVCRDGEAVGSDGGGDDCDFHVGANDCDGDDGFGGDVEVIEENATVVVMVVEMVQLLMVHVMEVMVMEAIVMEVMLVEVMEVKVMVVEVMLMEVMVMEVMVVEVSVGRG